MGWERVWSVALLVLAAPHVPADTLTTIGGKTYEGRIGFVGKGLRITTSEGEVLVPAEELKEARLGAEGRVDPSQPWQVSGAGVLCVNGSFLTHEVVAIDGPRVSFGARVDGLQLTTANTAGVFFRAPGPWEAEALRFERSGILLRSGDFMEANLVSLAEDQVRTNSILLGPRSFSILREVAGLLLRAPLPEEGALEIGLADGSFLRATEWVGDEGGLVLNGSPFRGYRVPLGEIRELRRGSQRSFLNLLEERWKQEGQSEGNDPTPFTDDPRLATLGRALARAHAIEKTRQGDLERARKEWQVRQQEWIRLNKDVNRARSDLSRFRSQVKSKGQQVASTKRAEEQARRDLAEKVRRAAGASKEAETARKALAATGRDIEARRRAETRLRNATRTRQNADRAVSQGKSRHAAALQRVAVAEKAQRTADEQMRREEEKEGKVREKADQAKRESENAKRRHDAAARELERAAAGVREANARLDQARKALAPAR